MHRDLLRSGTNKITFTLDATGNWKKGRADSGISTAGGGMPESPSAGVMDDSIRLEAGAVVGDDSCRLQPPPAR